MIVLHAYLGDLVGWVRSLQVGEAAPGARADPRLVGSLNRAVRARLGLALVRPQLRVHLGHLKHQGDGVGVRVHGRLLEARAGKGGETVRHQPLYVAQRVGVPLALLQQGRELLPERGVRLVAISCGRLGYVV